MGSNTKKKPWNNLKTLYKNLSKEINSDNVCYRKVGRAVTKWGAIGKSPILLTKYLKMTIFKGYQKCFCILMVAILFSPTVRARRYYIELSESVITVTYREWIPIKKRSKELIPKMNQRRLILSYFRFLWILKPLSRGVTKCLKSTKFHWQ